MREFTVLCYEETRKKTRIITEARGIDDAIERAKAIISGENHSLSNFSTITFSRVFDALPLKRED